MNLFENETFLTVISGVIIFVLSQWFVEYVIKPLQEYKKIKAKIAFDIVYYANIFHNPSGLKIDQYDKATKELRKDAAELCAFSIKKPIDFLPTAKKMQTIAKELIGLSNSINLSEITKEDFEDIREYEKNIKKGIGLKYKK